MERVPEGAVRVLAIRRGGMGVAAYEEADSINAALRDRWQKQSNVAELLREIAAIMPGLPAESWERCQAEVLNIIRHYVSPAPKAPTIAAPEICLWGTIFDSWEAGMKPGSKTVYSWKRMVRKLVAHLCTTPKLTVDEAMAWNAASLTDDELIGWKNSLVATLSATTIKNHLTILRTLYNHAADNKMLLASVAEAVKRVKHKGKKRPGTGRLGYTDDEARAILTAARQEHDPVLRWSPWLSAALGARIDEICGAMVADIEIDHDGIGWFNVRLDNREDDPDQDPELKSDNAERKIPLHPALRSEGFFDYVDRLPKGGALFPNLTPDRFGRRGGNGSKRVQRWVRSNKVGITDKRKAPSHSWRHRFRSIVRNPKYGIGEDVADYMSGHGGSGGEGRDYGEYRDAMVVAIGRLPPLLLANLSATVPGSISGQTT
jgi:integrase